MIAIEKSLKNLKLVVARFYETIIQSKKFFEDDEYIRPFEIKIFLYKLEKNELTLNLKLGKYEERTKEFHYNEVTSRKHIRNY